MLKKCAHPASQEASRLEKYAHAACQEASRLEEYAHPERQKLHPCGKSCSTHYKSAPKKRWRRASTAGSLPQLRLCASVPPPPAAKLASAGIAKRLQFSLLRTFDFLTC